MKKIQSAAIPFRLDEANRLSLLLITSRRKGRWVLPKGTVSGMLPHASAAREAFEEAGVIGSIAETPFETYYLRKKVGYGAAIKIPVHTFPMRVTVELQTWPEMDFRQRQWILAGQITEMVESEELRSLPSVLLNQIKRALKPEWIGQVPSADLQCRPLLAIRQLI